MLKAAITACPKQAITFKHLEKPGAIAVNAPALIHSNYPRVGEFVHRVVIMDLISRMNSISTLPVKEVKRLLRGPDARWVLHLPKPCKPWKAACNRVSGVQHLCRDGGSSLQGYFELVTGSGEDSECNPNWGLG